MSLMIQTNKSSAAVNHALLDAALVKPVEQFLNCGGKRIRGALTQIAYEIVGVRGAISTTICDAIEYLHAGSLVIDDIQDDSRKRRGQPTMHTEIGVPRAINAGNWMYFRALETLAHAPFDCDVRSAMMIAMIETGRKCHEGQALDLAARVDELEPDDYRAVAFQISEQKTGELVRLAMTLGGLAGGGSRSLIAAMDRFGVCVGVALQMRNDLDELVSLSDAKGNVRDDDLRNARVTWPWVWLASVDSGLASELSRRMPNTRAQSIAIAQFMLPKVAPVGEAAIGELLDRETRLLGEHVLGLESIAALERVLQPIRFGKMTISQELESHNVCNG